MSAFDERFANHGIFNALETLRANLAATEEHLSTVELQEAHGRLLQVADYIDQVLSGAEPALTGKAGLDALGNSVQSTANDVQQFIQTQQPAHLITNANNHADAALQQVRAVYVPLVTADVEGIRDNVVNFRRSAGQHLRHFEQQVADARASFEQQVKQVKQGVAQTTQQIENKLSELEQAKQGMDRALEQYQSQFSEAQDRRSTDFSKAVEARTEKLQEVIDDSRTRLDGGLSSLVAKGEAYVEEINQLKAQVEKIVGATGAVALSGGFNKTASEEQKAADRWRWIGVMLFLLAIASAALLFGPLHRATELTRIGAKAVIVIPLIGLGTYAFRESGSHRKVQWRNRRMALELASIDPYLALFAGQERNDVKKALIERWFAQPEMPMKDDSYSPSALVRLAETALGLLGKKL